MQINELKKIFPGQVFVEEKILQKYAGDLWPRYLIQKRLGQKIKFPTVVFQPKTILDVQKLVQWANAHQIIAIVPFGGGSGVCGGATITQESIALLKILALSGREIKRGNYKTLEKSFGNVRNRINDFKREQSEVQS